MRKSHHLSLAPPETQYNTPYYNKYATYGEFSLSSHDSAMRYLKRRKLGHEGTIRGLATTKGSGRSGCRLWDIGSSQSRLVSPVWSCLAIRCGRASLCGARPLSRTPNSSLFSPPVPRMVYTSASRQLQAMLGSVIGSTPGRILESACIYAPEAQPMCVPKPPRHSPPTFLR